MSGVDQLRDMQQYCANVGITASALRSLGAAGFVKAARQFLGGVNLRPLRMIEPTAYPKWLDDQTNALVEAFPVKLWGPARKAVNIFMTQVTLNRYLCPAYKLDRLECVLEVPLDTVVKDKLTTWAKERSLFSKPEFPKWKSIKALDPHNSEKYQQIAMQMAEQRGIRRGCLVYCVTNN